MTRPSTRRTDRAAAGTDQRINNGKTGDRRPPHDLGKQGDDFSRMTREAPRSRDTKSFVDKAGKLTRTEVMTTSNQEMSKTVKSWMDKKGTDHLTVDQVVRTNRDDGSRTEDRTRKSVETRRDGTGHQQDSRVIVHTTVDGSSTTQNSTDTTRHKDGSSTVKTTKESTEKDCSGKTTKHTFEQSSVKMDRWGLVTEPVTDQCGNQTKKQDTQKDNHKRDDGKKHDNQAAH